MDEREAFLRTIRENPGDDVPRLVYADWLQEHGEDDRAEFIRVQCELAKLGLRIPTSDTPPSHFCVECGALWRLWVPGELPPHDPHAESGAWSSVSECGPCCDNVKMIDQIRPINTVDYNRSLAIRRRERELFQANYRRWFEGLDPHVTLTPLTEGERSRRTNLYALVVRRGFVNAYEGPWGRWLAESGIAPFSPAAVFDEVRLTTMPEGVIAMPTDVQGVYRLTIDERNDAFPSNLGDPPGSQPLRFVLPDA